MKRIAYTPQKYHSIYEAKTVILDYQLKAGNLVKGDAEMESFFRYLSAEAFDSSGVHWKQRYELLLILGTLKSRMKEEITEFRYMKSDGTIRTAYGTRSRDILEERGLAPNGLRRQTSSRSTFTYFDIERGDWRSFILEDFIELIEEYSI